VPPCEPDEGPGRDAVFAAHALDLLSVGVLLVDGEGRVLERNRAAEEIVDGISLRVGRGRRADKDDPLAEALLACREAAASARGTDLVRVFGPFPIRRAPPMGPLVAVAAPVRPRAGNGAGSPLVFVTDPERERVLAATALERVFGLTPAESRLADLIARGGTPKEAARALGIQVATARVHLKRIFLKTGTDRQSSLVRRLLAAVIPVRGA